MKIDILLILGYVGILVVIFIGLLLSHGTPQEIWSAEGFILSFGGAAVGTMAMLSMAELKQVGRSLKIAFTEQKYDYEKLIQNFVNYATISRRDGILALESEASKTDDAFLRRALQMAVDGVDPDLVEDRLSIELASLEERHTRARSVFDTMATFSPAFGMVGTIMGLVLVLKGLDDPKMLGPKMSVALLSTFYGVFACYGVFTPIAKKLERKHKDENLYKQMIAKGIIWVESGDSPRVIESKLSAFLRAKQTK